MLKKIGIIVVLAILASCGAKKNVETASERVQLGDTTVVYYESLGNGVASIDLELFDNNTFQFIFKSIPQPSEEEKPIKISEKGTYTSEGNWKTLRFYNTKFDVASLFDSNYGDASEFKVVDHQTVKINTSSKIITIWGVACEKK